MRQAPLLKLVRQPRGPRALAVTRDLLELNSSAHDRRNIAFVKQNQASAHAQC